MAKETNGKWIDVNSDEDKGHVNIYDNDPREDHNSIHINIDYNDSSFQITEKEDEEKSTTDCKCFLTTACMRYFEDKFDDNCYELRVLRWFRDNFVTKEDIMHYYETAPIIVSSIDSLPNSNIIYDYIYDNVVETCVNAIEKGYYSLAYNIYKSSILYFEDKFVKPILEEKLVKILKIKAAN